MDGDLTQQLLLLCESMVCVNVVKLIGVHALLALQGSTACWLTHADMFFAGTATCTEDVMKMSCSSVRAEDVMYRRCQKDLQTMSRRSTEEIQKMYR